MAESIIYLCLYGFFVGYTIPTQQFSDTPLVPGLSGSLELNSFTEGMAEEKGVEREEEDKAREGEEEMECKEQGSVYSNKVLPPLVTLQTSIFSISQPMALTLIILSDIQHISCDTFGLLDNLIGLPDTN